MVREAVALLSDLNIKTEGMSFQFPEMHPGSFYNRVHDSIILHEPNDIEVHQPDISWILYWETVAHELAHKIQWEWHEELGHDDIFYAILCAIVMIWDLPLFVIDEHEHYYHPRNLKAGKQTGGVLMLQMIKNMADGLVEEGELFSNESSVVVPSGQENLGLVAEPDASEIA